MTPLCLACAAAALCALALLVVWHFGLLATAALLAGGGALLALALLVFLYLPFVVRLRVTGSPEGGRVEGSVRCLFGALALRVEGALPGTAHYRLALFGRTLHEGEVGV